MEVGRNAMFRNRLTELSLPGRVVALAAVALVGLLVALPLAFSLSGMQGVVAAAVAAALCLFASELGLLVAHLFHGPAGGMNGALAAMFVRMAIPLLGGVALHVAVPTLAAAGMFYYLIAFYMLDLSVETSLLVARLNDPEFSRREGA